MRTRLRLSFIHPQFKELGPISLTASDAARSLWDCSGSSLSAKVRKCLSTNTSSFTHRNILFTIVYV